MFIIGGQRIDQKSTLRKGAIVSSSPQGMTSWNSSIKFIECIIKKKICHAMKQYAKICAIGDRCNKLKSLIRRERRDGGEGEERGLRKGAERG